jgi:hypothetical protein
VIGGERAVKEELAIVEVWESVVALATVEGQVIEVARVNSAAVAGPVEAVPEAGAAPAAAALVVVAGHEVEVAEGEGGGDK